MELWIHWGLRRGIFFPSQEKKRDPSPFFLMKYALPKFWWDKQIPLSHSIIQSNVTVNKLSRTFLTRFLLLHFTGQKHHYFYLYLTFCNSNELGNKQGLFKTLARSCCNCNLNPLLFSKSRVLLQEIWTRVQR